MKKVCASLLVVAILFGWSANSFALPVFKKHFDEKYIGGPDANPDLKKAVETAKCNTCHFGAKKTDRNDYGKTLSKWLKKDAFKAPRLAAEKEAVQKEVMEALEKAEKEMSPAGGTYGDRLKEGKLPGTEDK
jgi:hypothetical protein